MGRGGSFGFKTSFENSKAAPCRRPNEWAPMEKPTRPQLVVSIKESMGTMGWDPQINEKDILGAGEFHSSAAKRATGLIFRIGILPSRA